MNDKRETLISREQYSFTHRQINKIKGYEVNFRAINECWPISLGFVKTISEGKILIANHKEQNG